MKSGYKKLGEYIELVSNTNLELHYGENDVIGVSNNKEIIQTRANNEGRDFNTFYIVAPNEFIYNSRTSRMGDKVGLGFNNSEKSFITSFNNTVFRVKNEALSPMFLFMWFNRPEFDRYVRYHSWGSSTEIFSWEEMCNTLLPVPSIEKQRELVKEYNIVVNRLKLNNNLIKKLEETAQTIYKQWFVDFEFPNEEGKPYKSSGGEMLESELGEVPKGWEVKKLESLTKQICVAFVGSVYDFYCNESEGIPMLRTTNITEEGISFKDLKYVTHEFHEKNKKSQLRKGDLLVARHGSNGMPVIYDINIEANALNVIIIKPNYEIAGSKFLYLFLTSQSVLEVIKGSLGGSVQEVLNTQKIAELKIAFPENTQSINEILLNLEKLEFFLQEKRKLKRLLNNMLDLLLSKLATIEK